MGFRIGRKHAAHTYPDTPRAAPAAFARNFALDTEVQTVLAGPLPGTAIIWDNGGTSGIESNPAGPLTFNVPITPRVTGRVRVILTVELKASATPLTVVAITLFNTTPSGGPTTVAAGFLTTLGPSDSQIVTFVYDFTPLTTILAVGVTTDLAVTLTVSGAASVDVNAATMDVQELPLATG